MTPWQGLKFGLGLLALERKHEMALPEVLAFAAEAKALYDSIVGPPAPQPPIHEVIAAHLTPEEQAQFDQAGKLSSGGM